MTPSWRTFGKALVVCLVLVAQLGTVIHLLNDGHHRPEGAAERWLTAVSDLGRAGVRDDAAARAEEIGPVAIAAPLVRGSDGDHGLFPDLEVGRARIDGDHARVPFRVHQWVPSGEAPEVTGTLLLARAGEEWRVTGLDPRRRAGELVPSEGGAPPSNAPATLWLLALAIGLAVTALASLLVHWAGRPGPAAGRPAAATVA